MQPSDFGFDDQVYFVDSADRVAPLIVEHATGVPAWVVVDGSPVPYVPRAAAPRNGQSASFRVKAGGLSLGISVVPPEG